MNDHFASVQETARAFERLCDAIEGALFSMYVFNMLYRPVVHVRLRDDVQ
jgi:hypothetical protein